MTSLRVATYNVHRCRGLDGRTSLSRIAEVVRSIDPDIIAMQEVIGASPTAAGHAEELGAQLGMGWVMAPARHLRHALFGNVVLSRHPIRDVGVPRSRDDMHAILACIDTSLRTGDPVYVHCWGGVGRTGTVIGCYLVGCGLSGDDALRKLAELFGSMEKSATKRSPETADQKRWVREWSLSG